MKPLIQAILNRFNSSPANAFYTAMGGKLYFRKVPQVQVPPWAALDLITDTPDWTFSESMEEVTVQISAYLGAEKSASNALDALEAMKALYDDCELTVTGFRSIFMRRENAFVDDTDGVWRAIGEYRILLEKV